MSLDFRFDKVKDYKNLTEEESVVLNSLIWATMTVGLNKITEDNVGEFYARLHMAEKLRGTWTTVDGKPHYLKREEIERFIGLTTNAGTFTRAAFNKRILEHYYAEYAGEK